MLKNTAALRFGDRCGWLGVGLGQHTELTSPYLDGSAPVSSREPVISMPVTVTTLHCQFALARAGTRSVRTASR